MRFAARVVVCSDAGQHRIPSPRAAADGAWMCMFLGYLDGETGERVEVSGLCRCEMPVSVVVFVDAGLMGTQVGMVLLN